MNSVHPWQLVVLLFVGAIISCAVIVLLLIRAAVRRRGGDSTHTAMLALGQSIDEHLASAKTQDKATHEELAQIRARLERIEELLRTVD